MSRQQQQQQAPVQIVPIMYPQQAQQPAQQADATAPLPAALAQVG